MNRGYTRKSLLVVIPLLLLAGCNQSNSGSTPNAANPPAASSTAPPTTATGKPKIALVMKSLANEFFQTMQKGAEKDQQANADKYELLVNGTKDEQDVAGQQQIVEQMIGQQVQAIVLAPADSKAMIPVCKKALNAHIAVVNIDNRFDADVLKEQNVTIPFVGPDNRKGAKLAGDYLAKRLKSGDPVAILEGIPTAFNAQQRRQGFEDAMNAGGMKIVASQSANWETDQANKVAAALLTAHPDLKAFLCSNDNMALGAVTALRAAGKTKQVLVVGYDNISAIQQLIKDGTVLCTVDQHADQLAVYGIEYALDILAKKAPPADKETPVDLITAETLK